MPYALMVPVSACRVTKATGSHAPISMSAHPSRAALMPSALTTMGDALALVMLDLKEMVMTVKVCMVDF